MEKLNFNIQLFADGEVVIKTTLDIKEFNNGLNKMQSKTESVGGTIKNIVASLGISSIIGKTIGMINSSLDGAISRFDTLNNYVNVMSNLGFESDKAQESINKISEGIRGLPTTLDAAALGVQRFTASNKDIEKSTKYFLALNDAIVSGGASTEIQNSALEQMMQAYSKGKPDLMEWRNLLTAMPAQLDQIATSMGYVGQSELYERIKEGSVSMDEFFDAIVKLDQEGGDGIVSFHEQALTAIGGIGTSVTNAKTAITRGVTSIITDVNNALKNTKFGSIANIISKLGKTGENVLKSFGSVLGGLISGDLSFSTFAQNIAKSLKETIPQFANFINDFINKINENLPEIMNSGIVIVSSLLTGITNSFPMLLESALNLMKTFAFSLIDNLDQIVDVALDVVMTLADGLLEALPILIDTAPKIIEKLLTKLTDPEMTEKVTKTAWSLITKLAIGIVASAPQLVLSVMKMEKILFDYIINSIKRMPTVGKSIVQGIWEGISGSFDWLKSRLKEWVGDVTSFLKKVFKIGSPSKLMRDEIGIYLAQGVGVGFDDELSGVYSDMQRAIDIEQKKLQASVETGKVFNTITNSTPIIIDINAPVEMDSQKVGRLITPTVSKTLKTGGVY